jgi:hypothetical protein
MTNETLDLLMAVLGWSMVFNYGILLLWMMFLMWARIWMYNTHNRWFNIPEQEFHITHYRLMGQFKLGILLLNLSPYLALRIVT